VVLNIDDASTGLNVHRPFPDDLYLLIRPALVIIVHAAQIRERVLVLARVLEFVMPIRASPFSERESSRVPEAAVSRARNFLFRNSRRNSRRTVSMINGTAKRSNESH